MPELPDLVYLRERLESALVGAQIDQILVKEPVIFRVLIPQAPGEFLRGVCFTAVERHGPFLRFHLDKDVEIVVHPMLAGKFKLTDSSSKAGRGLGFSVQLADGRALHYLDEKRMGKVYVIPAGETRAIPRFEQQGVDILSPAFTPDTFRQAIRGQRKQVRVFLMKQEILSAIGNAYADEILFDAGIHPKTFCQQLSEEQVTELYRSIAEVMRWGIQMVRQAGQPMEVKVRDHMRVRNRKNQPCPRCRTTIRTTGVLGHDAFFCPKCQPAQRSFAIDWANLPDSKKP